MSKRVNICSVCGSTHKVYKFKGEIPLCNKHYKQMYRHGKILERTTFDPNEIFIYGEYVELALYDINSTEIARTILNKEDLCKVVERKWYFSGGYVVSDTVKRGELMHRIITSCPDGMIVDHVNRNPLDNRRENLRVCTQRENVFNSGIRSDNKTGHTGVIFRKREKLWFSYISIDGKQVSLGYHKTKKQAIKARREGEEKYYGEYAPSKGRYVPQGD